jgi:four helix bundle protein
MEKHAAVGEFKTETKAMAWVVEVRKAVSQAPCDLALKDQIRRAAASVLLNIAEGAGYPNPRSQARHYTIARASIAETLAGLRLLSAERCISDSDARTLAASADEIRRMLYGLIRHSKLQTENSKLKTEN